MNQSRDPRAVEPLLAWMDDPDPAGRVAAAEALGWVPGSSDALRTWVESLPRDADPNLRAALLRSIGSVGTARDLGPLLAGLEAPWPVGEAAALALGRLGVRRVPAVEDAAVPALVDRLDAWDMRVVEACAFALFRLGLASASDSDVQAVSAIAFRSRSPSARAWALKAAWPRLEPGVRDDLFIDAIMSTSRVLRVAALDAVRPGDVPSDVLQAWLVDPDPWVRVAVVRALGRSDGRADLERIRGGDDPWFEAELVAAIGEGDAAVATDPDAAPVLRAAHIGRLRDEALLVRLAGDEDPSVRGAVAAAAMSMPDPPAGLVDAMAQSGDPVLREAAAGLPGPTGRWVAALAGESDPDVLAALLEALDERIDEDPRALRLPDPRVAAAVRRLAEMPTARARAVSDRWGSRLGLTDLPRPQLALPDVGRPAALSEIRRVRGARIRTDHGEFVVALDPWTAPLAVHAFATLAEQGFYDGLVLHRVVPGFVVQGGDPRGDGWGGPGFTLPDEVSALPFDGGALGMARSGPDTGGSQWFVTTTRQPHLVGAYTRFGEVVMGMERVARMPAGTVIVSITIERDDAS